MKYDLHCMISERFFVLMQEDEARACVAVYGLHIEAIPCDHHTVVRWI